MRCNGVAVCFALFSIRYSDCCCIRAIYIMSSSKRTVTRASNNRFNRQYSDDFTEVSAGAFVDEPKRSRKKPDILNISVPAVKRREVTAPKKKRGRSCSAAAGPPKKRGRPRGTTVAARSKKSPESSANPVNHSSTASALGLPRFVNRRSPTTVFRVVKGLLRDHVSSIDHSWDPKSRMTVTVIRSVSRAPAVKLRPAQGDDSSVYEESSDDDDELARLIKERLDQKRSWEGGL